MFFQGLLAGIVLKSRIDSELSHSCNDLLIGYHRLRSPLRWSYPIGLIKLLAYIELNLYLVKKT